MLMYDTVSHVVNSLQLAEAMCHVIYESLRKETPRTVDGILAELRFILRHFQPAVLVDFLATSGKSKFDSLAGSWILQTAAVCVELRKQVQERVEWMTQVFHKWGGSPMPDGSIGVVVFEDIYVRVENGKLIQRRKDGSNDCYLSIPYRLAQPSERVRKRLRTLRSWTTWAPADQDENGRAQKRGRGHVQMED